MREFQAEVVDVRDEGVTAGKRRWRLLLSGTAFAGEGGVLVAVSPSGMLLEIPVLGVVKEGAEVWHVVDKPLAGGTPVVGRVYDFDGSAGDRTG